MKEDAKEAAKKIQNAENSQAAKSHNVIYAVGQMVRYAPGLFLLHWLVLRSELGDVCRARPADPPFL